jgi:hypothetical protein
MDERLFPKVLHARLIIKTFRKSFRFVYHIYLLGCLKTLSTPPLEGTFVEFAR